MKIAPRRADGFCRDPDPGVRAVLVHGPDAGLARERADRLTAAAAGDLGDPFRVAELTGEAVAADPALLADEAGALALAGGRRAVRVKGAGDRLAGAVEAMLARPTGDALVVVEAGDLPRRSRLRALMEKGAATAAVACYRDEGRAVEAVAAEELRRGGVAADREALALLGALLGGDRLQTRAEAAKLALYVGEGGRATAADVEAVVADGSFLSMDRIVHAAAAGRIGELDRALERALANRENPLSILRAAGRFLMRLHLFVALRERGAPADEAARAAGAFHFRAVDALKAAAPRWTARRIERALDRLGETDVLCKTADLRMPAATLCRRALHDVARPAPAERKRNPPLPSVEEGRGGG